MEDIRSQFLLRDDITFLNFGSFGATPKPIFDDYQKWQLLLEQEPVQFITVDGYEYVRNSRKALAEYLNCNARELVFVSNPTYAINILAKNLQLKPGDEILTTDLEYGAMDRTWEYYCERNQVKYVRQHISLPLTTKEKFVQEFFQGCTEKTRIVFISQITSSTGLIFPVEDICSEAKKRGLITIVDGAHVPGHIPLDLSELQADFYTGACHKWMMAPKGCSFLFAREEFHDQLDPLIISWGYNSVAPSDSVFFDYHQFNGTRDFSAFLTIPACIEFMDKYDWPNRTAHCKEQLLKFVPQVAEALGTKPLASVTSEFYGQLCSTPIRTKDTAKLQRLLFEKYGIEIPVMMHGNESYIRFSYQVFNNNEEIHYLIDTLSEIRKEGILIY